MVNEYYGSTLASSDFFAHYGIKGMKWGVRKAIEKGDAKRLARQFKRAEKKLAKLNERADVTAQQKKANKYNKIAKVSGKIGLGGAALATAGTGTDHTLHYINSLHKQIAKDKLADLDREASKTFDDHWAMIVHNQKKYNNGEMSYKEYEDIGNQIVQWHTDAQNKINDQVKAVKDDFNKGKDKRKLGADIGRYVSYVGAGAGALGLGTAAVAKGKAIAAKRRTTAKGHAKAVAERDEWQRQMNDAFKGTSYDSSGSVKHRKKKR